MIKQLVIPFIAVAAFVVLVGYFTQRPGSINLGNLLPTASPTQAQTQNMTIGGKVIQVEIANTEGLREKGLGGRSSLDAERGMLFTFDKKQSMPIFWMKNMQIPIDIIWITGTKIIKIDKSVAIPAPNTPDNQIKRLSPNKPVDYVLEVNAGYSDTNNIKVGDSVIIP